jgi:uncharacterized protein YgbK (DUF1537 family)
VHLATPDADTAPISALATGTRDVDRATLAKHLAAPARWLGDSDFAFKKLDSLLRGNTLAEVAELLRGPRFARAVIAPAFPAQGRVTFGRQQRVRAPDGSLSLVGDGPIDDALTALGVDAARLDVPQVEADADLDAVVDRHFASGRNLLWCGSAGLGRALAARLGAGGAAAWHAPAAVLVVTASHHPVLRDQLAALRERGGVRVCTLDRIGEGAAFEAARMSLDTGRSVVLDLSRRAQAQPAAAADALAQRAARLVAAVERPPALLAIGGDTLLALCRAAGVRKLFALPAPRPGWGHATLRGGRWDGVPCLSRSGAFGGHEELAALLDPLAKDTP